MNEPLGVRIHRILALRERLIQRELFNMLIAECAWEDDFFTHLHLLPQEIVEDFRELARNAPATPDAICIVESICNAPGFDPVMHHQEKRRKLYLAAKNLKKHWGL